MSRYTLLESAPLYKEPMRKVGELAEEFGLGARELGRILHSDPTAPKATPSNYRGCVKSSTRDHFPLFTTRKWWANRQK